MLILRINKVYCITKLFYSVAELHHLAEYCEFGTTLNAMLWDRLVFGVEEPRIQRQLLAEPDLMFDKAFKLASAATQNVKDLQSTKSSALSGWIT